MKLSRFVGATSRDVMRQVRETLGSDALIVSNRSVPEGIEVLATLDDPPADQPAPLPEASLPVVQAAPPTSAAESAGALEAAIGALRGALESRLDGLLWGGAEAPGREPQRAALFRALLDAGFSARLVRAMLERLPAGLELRQAQSWARNELVTHLPVLACEDDLLAQGGVFALVGPTGVGKTTTLAKLAARCVAREGRQRVAMLTTDNFRIGALEQLQIYGRLMGVPARSVRDVAELRATLTELGDRKIILIDTTGISQRDRQVAAQAALLCGAGRPVRRLLVLNAASQGETLDEVAHAYRNGAGEDVAGCILTKLDEASRLGPALDTAIRHRLPVHYVCVGQKVPEHLALARADELVDRALAAPARAPALYAPSEADMATLWRASSAVASDTGALRRRQWLAAALLPGRDDGRALLGQACDWLERDVASGQARDRWRGLGQARDPAGQGADQDLAAIRRAFPAACERWLLAVHGEASLNGVGLPGAGLRATVLMSDRGDALGAAQATVHWARRAAAVADPKAVARADRAAADVAAALAGGLPNIPLVHVLDSGHEPPWRVLPPGSAWVMRQAGALKVLHDDCPTHLNAVGKSLGYLPVGPVPAMAGVPALRPAGAGDAGLAGLWASGTEVALPRRGTPPQNARLVCARVVAADGTLLRQLFALTSLSAADADAAVVARWLVRQDQARRAFRDMAWAWAALSGMMDGSDPAARAAVAAQLGTACWQIAQAPGAGVLDAMLQSALARGRKLTPRAAPAALLKIFAMLEMAA